MATARRGEFACMLQGCLDQVAREELLRRADLLLDEPAQRGLVARFESKLAHELEASPRGGSPRIEVCSISGALSLLTKSPRDPDITVHASLRYSPKPNPVQRQAFARAHLDADRPVDALVWLQDTWGHLDDSRQDLLADALERLGRIEESSPIRRRTFERTLSDFRLKRWLAHVPDAAQPEALTHARQLALRHDDLTAAAALLLQFGDTAAAEGRLLADHRLLDGNHYGSLVPLAKALRAHESPPGETVVYRALLKGILEQVHARAYRHAARYWARLGEIAASGVSLSLLPSHEDFEAEIRARHGRKAAFWAYANGTRRDSPDDDDAAPVVHATTKSRTPIRSETFAPHRICCRRAPGPTHAWHARQRRATVMVGVAARERGASAL